MIGLTGRRSTQIDLIDQKQMDCFFIINNGRLPGQLVSVGLAAAQTRPGHGAQEPIGHRTRPAVAIIAPTRRSLDLTVTPP